MPDTAPDLSRELLHALDPVAFARDRLGFVADPWQERVLSSHRRRLLMCCTRQAGKTTTTGIRALHTAMYQPGSLTLLFSKAQRQSAELLLKIQAHIATMDRPPLLLKDAATELRFANRSRIVSLPGSSPDSIRSFSAPDLIIEDEAGFVDDQLYEAFLPMLATSKNRGRLILMSTPNGKRGHFHAAWSSNAPHWQRESVTCYEVPRISAEYLEEMRSEFGPWKFRQEFECAFVEAEDQYFSDEAIDRVFQKNIPLLELRF